MVEAKGDGESDYGCEAEYENDDAEAERDAAAQGRHAKV